MPTFKTVWQFTESNGATFSEIWYKDSSSIGTVVNVQDNSVQLRASLLHPLNTLVRIRVSQVGVLRNTQNVLVNLAGGSPGNTPTGPLPAGAAAIITVAGVGGGSRKWWLRGIPRDYYNRNPTSGVDAPTPAFLQNLQVVLQALANAQYGILRLTPLANPAVQISAVTIVDGMTLPGKTILTMQTPIAFVPGSTAILSRFSTKDLPRLNGRFTVLAATANTITIPYVTPGSAKLNVNQGQLKLLAFDATHVINPASSGFDHFGTRTSKSPLFGSRGAKRAARIRQLA